MAQERLYLTMLGGCRAIWQEREELEFPTDKIRALLVYLCLESGRAHRRDALASLLWFEWPDQEARRNLRQSLYRLKQSLTRLSPELGEHLLEMDRQQVQLNADWIATDIWQWQELLGHSQGSGAVNQADNALTLLQLTEAISLYQGDFLAGLAMDQAPVFDEWLQSQRTLLGSQLTSALHQLAVIHRKRCEFEQSDQCLQRWLAIEPWNEEAHRERMRTLAMGGQRSAALAQYHRCEALLLDTFQADPTDETIALCEQIHCEEVEVSQQRAPITLGDASRNPRPPLPPRPQLCLGREQELADLLALVCDSATRLLTVFGGGGSGKTTLCTELLHTLSTAQEAFSDGVYMIPLAGITRTEHLTSALAQSLGLTDDTSGDLSRRCLEHLRQRRALLYWDNFEHLLEGKAFLTDLLAAAPQVTLLVTSRIPLALAQEQRYQIQGLSLEHATQLFAHWAHKVDPHFQSSGESDAIKAICERVAGIPLAVELAANWVQTLDCHSIDQEMQRDLSLLHTQWSDFPAHHRSMQSIFEHTWQMLAPAQQEAFASLAVFRGSFDLNAAREIAQIPVATLTLLWERALLQRPQKGRFSLQQMLQHFASDKLAQAPHQERYYRSHTKYYLALLRNYQEGFAGQYPQRTKQILNAELDNIRMAWQRAIQDKEFALLVEAADAMAQLYEAIGLLSECDEMFSQAAQACAASPDTSPIQHATLLLGRCFALVLLGQHEAALALLNTLPAEDTLPTALNAERYRIEGRARLIPGAYSEALTALTRAKDLYTQAPNVRGHSDTITQIGIVHWRKGDYEQVMALMEAGLKQDRATHYREGIASKLGILGYSLQAQGHPQQAMTHVQQALDIAREIGNTADEARCLNGLGIIFRALGEFEQALDHYQQAYELEASLGFALRANAALSNIAVVYWQVGRLDEALASFRQVLAVQDEFGEQGRRGLTLGNMGKVYKDLGQWQPALACLQEALALERTLGHQKEVARILGVIGEVYGAQGDFAQARTHMEAAIAMMREHHYQSNLCWMLVAYATLLHQHQHIQEAKHFNEEGAALARELQRKDIIEQSKQLSAALQMTQDPP